MAEHPPVILYLNTDPGARIPGMTLAGIRRYASARRWTAEAFSSEESRPDSIRELLVSRAPVAGCVYECCDDNIARPSCFRGVPVVYLHARRTPRDSLAARLPTDNEAVAEAAFRELSAGHPTAFAVVGHAGGYGWSRVRERAFAALAAKAKMPGERFIWRDESAESRAQRLWVFAARLPRHTAIFAANDIVAAEVVAAVRAAHRAIPRELTLIGVDNHLDICEASEPQISSIQIDHERAGFVAASMLAATMKSRAARGMRAYDGNAVIGPLLVVRRESTGGWGRREVFVLDAVEMIRREACDGLTAAALARQFPCSRNLFDLRFREAVGRSVLDEILHVRLEKACTLLARTDTEISAVPGLCGFRTHTALDRLFRSRFGMSMRDWRKNNA